MSERRKPTHHSNALPVNLVIVFVGLIGVLSLIIGAWLFWLGKSGEGVLAITNGCVMGLLALLGRTEPQQQPQLPIPVSGPDGGAVPVKEEEKAEPKNDVPAASVDF